ncbi:hypothetical protein DNHGIG_21590 [Collibacillus ludicampi]|uniref:DUF1904 family protein n=1 Tax=Collibacillus ludicampi TaxID=2771369 RepID=A0AAV4LFH7_9BACL|nr:DUF1904 family protein [Collibacillus ludicampi]GIM46610.1 hypothetical protein DNHGIG_21590 [Collibacillus ludicampi]
MPFLRFKGFEKDFVRNIADRVRKEFASIVDIPEEIVKIEILHVERITDTPLSLEIFMFEREPEKHHRIASCLYRILNEHGYQGVHIFFVFLKPEFYYKFGKPLVEHVKT